MAILAGALAVASPAANAAAEDWALNYHLMHPGGESTPGDPNVAFCLDGTYHLHYIWQQPTNAGFLEAGENRVWEPATK